MTHKYETRYDGLLTWLYEDGKKLASACEVFEATGNILAPGMTQEELARVARRVKEREEAQRRFREMMPTEGYVIGYVIDWRKLEAAE